MSDSDAPLAYRPAEAAAKLGLGKVTLYKLLKQGRLLSVKIGARTLIPASELSAFLQREMERGKRAAA